MKSFVTKAAFLLGLALAPIAALGQVVFTVSGTVNATGNGFTAGQAVTFTFTLAQTASNTGSNSVVLGSPTITGYRWADEVTSDPILWADVTGSPFSDTYTRPVALADSPWMELQIEAVTNRIRFLAAAPEPDEAYTESMGLTFGGNNVTYIYAIGRFTGLSFDFTSETLPDATTYFSANLGTYSFIEGTSPNSAFFYDGASGDILFTPTSLTISAVPEPSTYAAILGALALGLVAWKRRRAA
jgi:hypothetical protein